MYSIPDQKSEKYCTFGIGDRPKMVNYAGNSSPPPNTYSLKTSVDFNKLHKKGSSLGERLQEQVFSIYKRNQQLQIIHLQEHTR